LKQELNFQYYLDIFRQEGWIPPCHYIQIFQLTTVLYLILGNYKF
jgi:hypothetical protein